MRDLLKLDQNQFQSIAVTLLTRKILIILSLEEELLLINKASLNIPSLRMPRIQRKKRKMNILDIVIMNQFILMMKSVGI